MKFTLYELTMVAEALEDYEQMFLAHAKEDEEAGDLEDAMEAYGCADDVRALHARWTTLLGKAEEVS